MASNTNITVFIEGLKSKDENVVRACVIGLKNSGDETQIPLLIQTIEKLNDFDKYTRDIITNEILGAVDQLSKNDQNVQGSDPDPEIMK